MSRTVFAHEVWPEFQRALSLEGEAGEHVTRVEIVLEAGSSPVVTVSRHLSAQACAAVVDVLDKYEIRRHEDDAPTTTPETAA